MPGSFLRFQYKILTLGRRLTDQQLWCLGCDVRSHEEGLRELGWTYIPRADKTKGCGRLVGMLPDGGHFSMWGFGFLARDLTHGALWLERRDFRPKWSQDIDPSVEMFALNQIPRVHAPRDEEEADSVLFLLGQLAERLAEYEEDIQSLLGKPYRQQCLDQWKFRCSALSVDEVVPAWKRIAQEARKMRETHTYAPGKKPGKAEMPHA